jgi:Icc protein
VEVQRALVEPADPAAPGAPVDVADRRPALELTTVASDSATFHRGTAARTLDGLQPATAYRHEDVAFETLPRPAGALRCRLATVNDVHFGEVEAGRVDRSDRGPIVRVRPGELPYPETMNRAAVAEIVAAEDGSPFAAVVAKGDLTADGTPEQFAAFEACYRPAFGDRLHAVRGNHDRPGDQDAYAGDRWIDLPGVNVALLDTTLRGEDHGAVDATQLDWLDALAEAATDPVIVMGHHPLYLGDPVDDPRFSLLPDASASLDAVFARRTSVVAYTAGHTHRHRVQRAGGGIPSVEVGCVKDFPGTWAEYDVYDGGITQVVHRVSSPAALDWSERCRGLYADFGVDYTSYALGRLTDRCFVIRYR